MGTAWGSSEARGPVRPRTCRFDRPINGEAFLAYAQTFLGPTLKPGDVVIMDNLGGHRSKAVRKAVRQGGS